MSCKSSCKKKCCKSCYVVPCINGYAFDSQFNHINKYNFQTMYQGQHNCSQNCSMTYGCPLNTSCNGCNTNPCKCYLVCKKKKDRCGKCKIDPCCCKIVCVQPPPPCPIILYKARQHNLLSSLGGGKQSGCGVGKSACSSITEHIAHGSAITALINPWGMIFNGTNLIVANEGSQTIGIYGATIGSTGIVEISVTGFTGAQNPTGVVYNTNANWFLVPTSPTTPTNFISAQIIAVTLQGGIVAALSTSSTNTVGIYQSPYGMTSYTGATLTMSNLIVANFGCGTVDVFSPIMDGTTCANTTGVLAPPTSSISTLCVSCCTSTTNPFTDPYPIPNYTPFNVVNIGNLIYVLYAKVVGIIESSSIFVINPTITTTTPLVPPNLDIGLGKGYINVFTLTGTFIKRFASGGPLNAPYGMIPIPLNSSFVPGSFLVGNFGDSTINIYDANGIYLGKLRSCYGNIISLSYPKQYDNGLFSLIISNAFPGKFYFSSGIMNETQGLIGYFTDCSGPTPNPTCE